MHSYKRTLWDSLRNKDKDRLSSRHDMVCQYVAWSDFGKKIILDQPSIKNMMEHRYHQLWEGERKRGGWVSPNDVEIEPSFEMPINKGVRTKSVVGFMDVVLRYKVVGKIEWDSPSDEVFNGEKVTHEHGKCAVEIKTAPVLVGDLLRQMKLYREFVHDMDFWVVVGDFDMDGADLVELESEEMLFYRLDTLAFEAWVAKVRSEMSPA